MKYKKICQFLIKLLKNLLRGFILFIGILGFLFLVDEIVSFIKVVFKTTLSSLYYGFLGLLSLILISFSQGLFCWTIIKLVFAKSSIKKSKVNTSISKQLVRFLINLLKWFSLFIGFAFTVGFGICMVIPELHNAFTSKHFDTLNSTIGSALIELIICLLAWLFIWIISKKSKIDTDIIEKHDNIK